jgi:hypothetical protein
VGQTTQGAYVVEMRNCDLAGADDFERSGVDGLQATCYLLTNKGDDTSITLANCNFSHFSMEAFRQFRPFKNKTIRRNLRIRADHRAASAPDEDGSAEHDAPFILYKDQRGHDFRIRRAANNGLPAELRDNGSKEITD